MRLTEDKPHKLAELPPQFLPSFPFLQASFSETANRFVFLMISVSKTNPNDIRKKQRSMWETGEKEAISGEKGIKK